MTTKKEPAKKIKAAPKKKTAAKTRTVSAQKKVVRKTKTAAAPKKTIKKTKTIASIKKVHAKTMSAATKPKTKNKKWGLKRATYMVLSLAVGVLSAAFVAGLLEMIILKNTPGLLVNFETHRFFGLEMLLPLWVCTFLSMGGLVFGLWLGFWGWRMVYVEHRHRMFKK